jgi:delta 1-pyrroline-5-carboxylate dehydrogenase
MLILKIFLLILLTSIAGIVAEIFVGNSPVNAMTELNSSALKNAILSNETIRLPPNHGPAVIKIPILNQIKTPNPLLENTTTMLPKTSVVVVAHNTVYLTVATIALVAATVSLVLVTRSHAKHTAMILDETRNTVKEMKRATEAQFAPWLFTTFNTTTGRTLTLTTRCAQITSDIVSVRVSRVSIVHVQCKKL